MARMIDADKVVPLCRLLLVGHDKGVADAIAKNLQDVVDTHTVDAVPVVRCRDCVHAVEIEKDHIRKLFIDGTKACDIGRGDLYYGESIIGNDGFCDSGERKEK
jgi:hypothetical protein|nr:MAG TPA_asm: hypothetical protein [Caudoviricetes sp.]